MAQTLSEKIVGSVGTGEDPTELDNLELLSTAEIGVIDSVTAGTVTASKAAVVDSNKDIGDFRNLDATNFDAGLSGTAGSVDIFPGTASKGKLSLTAADSAGDTTTTIVNASQSGARTYTIPDAGASASFVMTAGNQTITGTKTIPALVTTDIDAGASGTAGTVDVFPTTASKGKLQIAVTDQTGDTTVSLQVGAMAAARTITLRDPGAAASFLTTTDGTAAATTSTAVELNKLDDSVVILTPGSGVSAAETNKSGYLQNGGIIETTILVDLTGLVGSTTDLDIIGNTGGAANCHFGQITTAANGTMAGGMVTCLEVPAGGVTDIDFYSAVEATGAQDALVTGLTETALVTSGGVWTSGATKGMTAVPAANEYIYIANGAGGVPGTFTAGKFLITLFGK